MAVPSSQLPLLETEPFAGGPARLPAVRRKRSTAQSSLTLPLSGAELPAGASPVATPPPLASRPVDPKRAAIQQVIAQIRAKLFAAEMTAVPPDICVDTSPPETPPPPRGESLAPFDERRFQFEKPSSPRERASIVSTLARRLDGHVGRGGHFEASAGDDRLTGRMETGGFVIAFNRLEARSRWLPAVQEVAREHGLSEPE
jgi:hypothetical protein